MKSLLRNYLINLAALVVTTKIIPGLMFIGDIQGFLIGALVLMLINISVVPLLKVMFLPLNLLTFGLFTWVINVIALYILTLVVAQFRIVPYQFPGLNLGFVTIPSLELTTLYVAIIASFIIGFTAHFLSWLSSSK